ncbi:mitochondrial protein [Kwoniella mangroviensis CBS 10435]|uniref:Cytochrome c oxidase assembly factor 3 n=1 Tax=Kwoniella mangroviensis CBS 10435 TaxID=1331196 RepID=A0A1B9IX64_9TREE|nr:mitochondrial protein [Kwoniella mangroviensis CBS 8507]OCF60121.1 mitochondrial protein [Kwoniella mangroviensis CBS 10435]OCF69506.1 mitochondrial protein [Kwoniella mangroviensis CBS 8507]OCF72286.1 mitochondrial protein [Kwoniella mangroviensis CBS 8886]
MSSSSTQVERAADRSYHPKGYGMSPSLQRARKPFVLTNVLIGGTLFAFAVGVYVYSISAVKQDDFSDVEDLLPPLEERRKLVSIEDEQRASKSLQSIASALPLSSSPPPRSQSANTPLPYATSSGSSPSKDIPQPDLTGATLPLLESRPGSGSGWGIKRISELEWIRKRGLVDPNGNVLVWGAPNVDRIGNITADKSGKRLV